MPFNYYRPSYDVLDMSTLATISAPLPQTVTFLLQGEVPITAALYVSRVHSSQTYLAYTFLHFAPIGYAFRRYEQLWLWLEALDWSGVEVGDIIDSLTNTPTPFESIGYQLHERGDGIIRDVLAKHAWLTQTACDVLERAPTPQDIADNQEASWKLVYQLQRRMDGVAQVVRERVENPKNYCAQMPVFLDLSSLVRENYVRQLNELPAVPHDYFGEFEVIA